MKLHRWGHALKWRLGALVLSYLLVSQFRWGELLSSLCAFPHSELHCHRQLAKWPWAEISDSLSQNKPSVFFKSVIKGIFVIVAERKLILRKRHCILK